MEMLMHGMSVAAMAAALVAIGAAAQAQSIDQGRDLARRNCAQCHAIGETGKSPNAKAPPFRELNKRHYPFDWLVMDLKAGMLRHHPAMPDMRFNTGEIDALVAYLKSIQQPVTASDETRPPPNQPHATH
jgi:mono/diheme cytochrome c family protein